MYNEAMSRLNDLVGKKIRCVSRHINIVSIRVGDTITIKSSDGTEKSVPEFSLHIQCPFRLNDEKQIILGYSDLLTSNNEENHRVDLNVYNSTIFDTKCDCFNKSDYIDKKVVDVKLSKLGDLNICLENFQIQTFIADICDYEAWRFFKAGSYDNPLVVYSNKMKL